MDWAPRVSGSSRGMNRAVASGMTPACAPIVEVSAPVTPALFFSTSFLPSEDFTADWFRNGSVTPDDPTFPNLSDMIKTGASQAAATPSGIITAANRSAGPGGRGFRHIRADGVNAYGGGFKIEWGGFEPELWFRYYMRYMSGFTWSLLSYTKEFYWNTGSQTGASEFEMGWQNGTFGIHVASPGRYLGHGQAIGTLTSDGNWHCYEAHFKMDTNGSNGVAEFWIDDVPGNTYADVDFGGNGAGWEVIFVGHNGSSPANGFDGWVDFDDLALSRVGRIGP